MLNFRKLIAFGKNSFVVSLPKQWVQKNNLVKGAVLRVDEHPQGLLITTEESAKIQPQARNIIIDVEGKDIDLIKTEIVSAYLKNYDTIEIIAKNLKTNATQIYDILRNLAGLEIMEQTTTKIVAKDLININDINIKVIVRRMDIIARAMMIDVLQCIDKVEDHCESIRRRDIDVNRLHFLAYRAIRRGINNPNAETAKRDTPWNLHIDKMIVTNIEMIADMQKRIARYLKNAKLKKKEKEDLKAHYEKLQERYLDVMKSYYNNDHNIAKNIESTSIHFVGQLEQFEEDHQVVKLTRVVEHFKNMARSTRNIARNVLSKEIEEKQK